MEQFKTLEIVQKTPNSRVFHLYLNRPSRGNALSHHSFSEFPRALAALDQNPDVNVVVLSGAGKNFCAGIDLASLGSVTSLSGDRGRSGEKLRRDIKLFQDSVTAIERCRKPVIAAVHGACIGGGVDILTACDVRFCTEDAFFSVKEVDLAIIADLGTLQRLPAIVGYGNAMELALTGRRFSGSEAKELGLVSKTFGSKDEMDKGVGLIAEDQEPPNYGNQNREGHNGGRLVVSSKTAKLEFPRFSGDDPTEWFNRVNQFEFQNTPETQKVSLASYHLEGEANQWWQWIRRTFEEEGRALSWAHFEELWARFGPSECEDFDEALSRIRQDGYLRDYQREFERLGNRVRGWTQKAIVGTFMGGLKTDIADGIRMFKPQTLKEAIGLARMKDDQLTRQQRFTRPTPPMRAPLALPPANRAAPPTPANPVRRLTWEEMQRRRA